MIICPLMSNPDVAREFNEIKDATTSKAAYHFWSANNGNGIDKAPNGEPSNLFKRLLSKFNGNRIKAIRAKVYTFGKTFLSKFGDWINHPETVKDKIDENGEPNVFMSEKEYIRMLDELELSREKVETFIDNFYRKILKVNPRYKVNEERSDFVWMYSTDKNITDSQKIDLLASKIFGYPVYLDYDNEESLINSIQEELDKWVDVLQDRINNYPAELSNLYKNLYWIRKKAKLLTRYLKSKAGLNEEENAFVEKYIKSLELGKNRPITNKDLGYQIQKIKEEIRSTERLIQKKQYVRYSKTIAAKNRIVAMNVIKDIKQTIKDRILAEYRSYQVKDSSYEEKIKPLLPLIDKIRQAIDSSTSDSRTGMELFANLEQKEISYDELYNIITTSYPESAPLLQMFKNANPEVKIKIGGDREKFLAGEVTGKFHPKTNTLFLFNNCDIYTAIHELAHSATYFGMMSESDEQKPFANQINEFMDYIRNYIKDNKLNPSNFYPLGILGTEVPANVYGFTNASEFIAELFSNPKFAQLLDTIPAMEDQQFKSLLQQVWDSIVDFLNKLLGEKSINKTALDQAKKLGMVSMYLQQQHIDNIYNQLKEISEIENSQQNEQRTVLKPSQQELEDNKEGIHQINNLQEDRDNYITRALIDRNVKDEDILTEAQKAKKEWIESRQRKILNDTQLRLAEAYGLRKEITEDGRIRFVSNEDDEKSRLIIDFLDYIADGVQGYYDNNSTSAAAHHVIAISLTNGDPSTFSHELAHHYIAMFRNSKLVQTALKAVDRPGMTDEEREEALVDIITAKTEDSQFLSSVESNSFFQKFWGSLANMLYTTFGIENQAIRNAIYRNATIAFMLNEQQQNINAENVVFEIANTRKFKSNRYKKALSKARNQARINETQVNYERIGEDKLQEAIQNIVEGSISRNKQSRKGNVDNQRTLVSMQIAENEVRQFVEDINEYRQNYLSGRGIRKPNRKQKKLSAYTDEEKQANIKLITNFIQQAKQELEDLAYKFAAARSSQYKYYISKEIVDPQTGDVSVEYLDASHLNDPDVTVTDIDFEELSSLQQNVIGFYERVIKQLDTVIQSVEFENEYGKDVREQLLDAINEENVGDKSLLTALRNIQISYQEMLRDHLKGFVAKYVRENCKDLSDEKQQRLIFSTWTWLENQNAWGDVSWFENWVGMASSSKSSVIRIMQDIVDTIEQEKRNEVNNVGAELRQKRLKAMAALNRSHYLRGFKWYSTWAFNIDKLLMERDDNGFTGNILTAVNEGKFYNDRSNFINDLLYSKNGVENRLKDRLGSDFELPIDTNGEPIFPEGQDDIEKEYLHKLNEWTGKHAVRRYTTAYYDKQIEMLSSKTRRAQTAIQNKINEIIGACTIDGEIHTELLTSSQMSQLQKLYYEQQQLSNPFDRFGRKKEEGTDEYQIAKELTEWSKWRREHVKSKLDYEAYEKAKNNATDKDLFERNNTIQAINPEIWDEIAALFPNTSKSTVDELRETRAKLVSIIKLKPGLTAPHIENVVDPDTGIIRPGYEEFWENLRKYDLLIQQVKRENPMPKNPAKKAKYKTLLQSTAILVNNLPGGKGETWYGHLERVIAKRTSSKAEFEKEINNFKWILKDNRGRLIKSGWLSVFFVNKPPATRVKVKGNFIDSTVRQPIQAYSTVDVENSDKAFVDDRFDKKLGKTIQPITDDTKRSNDEVSYTNQKYKDLIENGPKELKEYYDEILNVMKMSYENMPFLGKYDGRLVQKGATTRQMRHRENWWNPLKPFVYWFKRHFFINESDVDINVDYELRPDGTRAMNIPVRYVRRLDNPTEINSDLMGNVIDFYEMSVNYKKKSEKLPLMNSIISRLEGTSKETSRKNQTSFAKGIVNRQFYERNRTMEFGEDNFKSYSSNILRLSLKYIPGLRSLTTTGLLALNWLAGIVAYLDPAIQIGVDAFCGKYMDLDDYLAGTVKMICRLPSAVLFSSGRMRSNDKISSGMMKFGLAKSGAELYRNSDRSRLGRIWTNGITMLPFSLGEYTVNAQVFCIVMNSFKYNPVTKTYMNKQQYYKWAQDNGISLRDARKDFKTKLAKHTLFDAYVTDEKGNFVPANNEYGRAITKEFEMQLGKRIRNRATNANYIVPSTERTKIQSNIYSAYLVVMRTFMLVGFTERLRSLRDFQSGDDTLVSDNKLHTTQEINKEEFYGDKGGWNFQTGEIEDGIWSGFSRMVASPMFSLLKYAWTYIKQSIKQRTFKPHGLEGPEQFKNVAKYAGYQLRYFRRSRYHEESIKKREQYKISETDLYGFDRVVTELLVFLLCVGVQVLFHNKMNDDDNKKKYWYQVADHILIRTALVRLTWFDPDTVMDLFNSVTPSKGDIDKKLKFIDLIIDAYKGFQEHGTQYEDWERVKTGGYKHAPKAMRDLFQTLSSIGLHNAYTSSNREGVETKTKFFKNIIGWKFLWNDEESKKAQSTTTVKKSKDRFDKLDERLDKLDKSFDNLDKRMNSFDDRLNEF